MASISLSTYLWVCKLLYRIPKSYALHRIENWRETSWLGIAKLLEIPVYGHFKDQVRGIRLQSASLKSGFDWPWRSWFIWRVNWRRSCLGPPRRSSLSWCWCLNFEPVYSRFVDQLWIQERDGHPTGTVGKNCCYLLLWGYALFNYSTFFV